MPQPRERQQQQDRNQQDQSPNKQGRHPQKQAQESGKHPNPDRYPDQGKQAQKPSDVHYPEQDPSGKAERPDAVDGAEASRPDRGQKERDLN